MEQTLDNQTLVAFEIENVMGIHSLSVQVPDGATLGIFEGGNGTGKSSALTALATTIGGKRLAPEQLITAGEDSCRVLLETQALVATLKVTAKGRYIEVKGRDGRAYSRPQELWDGLCNAVALDPTEFVRQKPREQAETLLRLAGVDVTGFDEAAKAAYDARRDLARDLERVRAQIAGLPDVAADDGEVLDAAVTGEALLVAERQMMKREAAERDCERACASVEALKRSLADAQLVADRAAQACVDAKPVDMAPLQARHAAAQAQQKQAVTRRQCKALTEQEVQLNADVAREQDALDSARQAKADALAAASWPVPGLGVDGETVTWHGLPLAQASGAERLRVGTAIAFALRPGLRVVLMDHGSELDTASLRMVADIAAEHGGQVWLSRVADGELSVRID